MIAYDHAVTELCTLSHCNVSTYKMFTKTYDSHNTVLTELCLFCPESFSGQMMLISISHINVYVSV